MTIQFVGLPTRIVETIRTTRRDAYGEPVEQHLAGGDAYPCRHCLGQTPPGDQYLILAHRPFRSRNPYAENRSDLPVRGPLPGGRAVTGHPGNAALPTLSAARLHR